MRTKEKDKKCTKRWNARDLTLVCEPRVDRSSIDDVADVVHEVEGIKSNVRGPTRVHDRVPAGGQRTRIANSCDRRVAAFLENGSGCAKAGQGERPDAKADKEEDSWYSPAAVERVQCRSWSKKAVGEKRSVGRSAARFRGLVGVEPCGPPGATPASCSSFDFSLSLYVPGGIAIAGPASML